MKEKDLNELIEGSNEEQIAEKKLKILEAAIKVFSEKGFEGSRTSEIAKEAEVAEGTIFKYFKTKKDLLSGLLIPLSIKFLRPLIMKSAEDILKKDKENATEEILKELFLDRLSLIKKNMPLIKTVLVEAIYHDELLEPIKEQVVPQVLQLLDSYVDSHKQNGDFNDYNTRLISRTMMSLLMGYIVLSSVFPEFFSLNEDEKEIESIVDIFLNGVKNKGEQI
ncbi:MAG: TetR/AcrR family transcriptional regulator [Clostridiales bacterium]|nr:TetR/AcrR family transcriptional regulator [Clostridiales bacterium]